MKQCANVIAKHRAREQCVVNRPFLERAHLRADKLADNLNVTAFVELSQHVALMAQRVGKSRWDGWLTPKVGLYTSGLLYRVVIDTEESEAIMFGGFVAVDIKEYAELYLAPNVMISPPAASEPFAPSWGLAIGVQIPLGDYLARLGSD